LLPLLIPDKTAPEQPTRPLDRAYYSHPYPVVAGA